jgi:predicted nucleic acid-binding protein
MALREGRPLPIIDSLIAATAIVHNLTVVTRNLRGFERCGAAAFSPWTGDRV